MKNLKKRLALIGEIYRPFYGAFGLTMLIALFSQGIALVTPLIYGSVVDGIIGHKPTNFLLILATVLFALSLFRNVLELCDARIDQGMLGVDLDLRINDVTLRRVTGLSLGQVTSENSGFKRETLREGENALKEAVRTITGQILPDVLRFTVALVGLFLMNWILGSIALVCAIGFLVSSFIINAGMLPMLRKQSKAGNEIGSLYSEIIRHLRLVMVHNQEDRVICDYSDRFRAYGEADKRLWFGYFTKVTLFRHPFIAFGQFLVLVASIYLTDRGDISTGQVVTVLAWTGYTFGAIGNTGSIQRRLMRNFASIGRYFDLLEMPPAVNIVSNPIRPDKFKGGIEFRNVSFEYPGKEQTDEHAQTVRNMSFTIEPGTTCAFVGASGAGKSTAINLLLRGYDPDEGQILIDGHDLRLLDLGHWRKSVGCVEQDPRLWDATLRFNILYGLNGEARLVTDQQLDDLARKTCIDRFYHRLGATRFETVIGENGIKLSGGERQRVAIARAIIKDPAVMVFDEATNALDNENEQLIHKAIRNALEGRTGIIIAHRLSTIRHADQIIVFENGRIVGNGTHADLMKSCPRYSSLVEREIEACMS